MERTWLQTVSGEPRERVEEEVPWEERVRDPAMALYVFAGDHVATVTRKED